MYVYKIKRFDIFKNTPANYQYYKELHLPKLGKLINLPNFGNNLILGHSH